MYKGTIRDRVNGYWFWFCLHHQGNSADVWFLHWWSPVHDVHHQWHMTLILLFQFFVSSSYEVNVGMDILQVKVFCEQFLQAFSFIWIALPLMPRKGTIKFWPRLTLPHTLKSHGISPFASSQVLGLPSIISHPLNRPSLILNCTEALVVVVATSTMVECLVTSTDCPSTLIPSICGCLWEDGVWHHQLGASQFVAICQLELGFFAITSLTSSLVQFFSLGVRLHPEA